MRVIATPMIIASVLSSVGALLCRESIVAENLSPSGSGPGEVGEDADDLGPEVVTAAFAAQRRCQGRQPYRSRRPV